MIDRPRYVLCFEPLASRPGEQWSATPDVRVRRLLKHALRGLGLRCTSAREEPAVTLVVRYELDGLLEQTLPLEPGVRLPAVGDGVRFGSEYAHVVARQYAPREGSWVVHLSRHPDGFAFDLDAGEEARWRRAGFRPKDEPEGEAPWKEV